MKYYPTVTEWILLNLPEEHYACWMVNEMQTFPSNEPGRLKAARWVGYAMCLAEQGGYLNNQQSRDLTRLDVSEGGDYGTYERA